MFWGLFKNIQILKFKYSVLLLLILANPDFYPPEIVFNADCWVASLNTDY